MLRSCRLGVFARPLRRLLGNRSRSDRHRRRRCWLSNLIRPWLRSSRRHVPKLHRHCRRRNSRSRYMEAVPAGRKLEPGRSFPRQVGGCCDETNECHSKQRQRAFTYHSVLLEHCVFGDRRLATSAHVGRPSKFCGSARLFEPKAALKAGRLLCHRLRRFGWRDMGRLRGRRGQGKNFLTYILLGCL